MECTSPTYFLLRDSMRLVWEQHVYWTRMLLISIAHRLPDKDATETRLMRNPGDIAEIFAHFYGKDAGQTIESLLTEHLQIGGELITALRDGKTAEAAALNQKWYINADKMAAAFASLDPGCDREELRRMLYHHLSLTADEVSKRLAGDYAALLAVEQELYK